MALKKLFARLFAPVEVDFTGWRDARLLEHWRTRRHQLSPAGRATLEAELQRRGLRDAASEPPPAPPEPAPEPVRPPWESMAWHVDVLGPGGVLLHIVDDFAVLVLMPVADAQDALALVEATPRCTISTLVVLDPDGSGYLPTAALAARHGLERGQLYAVAPPDASIDRPPPGLREASTGLAPCRLEPSHDLGVRLAWLDAQRPDVLVASWLGKAGRACIGARIAATDLARVVAVELAVGALDTRVSGRDAAPWIEALAASEAARVWWVPGLSGVHGDGGRALAPALEAAGIVTRP